MAKTKISEFSTTAGNNTDINSINIAEGCAPSGINDAIRELMRQLKEFQTGGAGDSVNSGGDFSVATNKFTVASASGNTAVAGTLAVTGTTTLTGALVANGNATLGDGSGDTVTVKGTPTLEVNPTLSGGTANGVLYLNGSKVATSGSALTYNGTTLTVVGGNGNAFAVDNTGQQYTSLPLYNNGSIKANHTYDNTNAKYILYTQNSDPITFAVGGITSEQMRLTSTGLGIGTSSPSRKLTVVSGSSGVTIASAAGALFENNSHQYIYSVTPANYQNAFLFGGGSDNDAGLIWEDGTRGNVFNSNINVGAGYWTWTHGATENMRLDSSGNLGIGTTSPSSILHVSGSGSLEVARFATTTDNTPSIGIYSNGSIRAKLRASSAETALLTQGALPLLLGTNDTERARIDSSGTLCVNTTNPAPGSGAIQVAPKNSVGFGADASAAYYSVANYYNGSFAGGLYVTTGATALITSSDYRLKNTIQPMSDALAKVAQLKPVTYKWNSDGSDGEGFIAHELAEVFPKAVIGEKDALDENGNPKYQGIDKLALIATLTAAIQEQQTLIQQLTARVAQLESN